MTSNDIRTSFLDFFAAKGHHIVASAPVVPQDDPTLLFTNAGMNQFKDIFLGIRSRQYARVADSQKCIRVSGKHNDLEEVGRDTYHHTFFEMLGNWSFGDYFKAEAIAWAWELLTEVWGLQKDSLYATVFSGDERDGVPPDQEAADEWNNRTDIGTKRILQFGKKDNFWEMGDTGPCGPCSEIHLDRGKVFCDNSDPKHVCGVNGGCGRFIELWNLVFIQYNRDASGKLTPLPDRHVDTGAGFERLVSVLQDKKSNYDIDLFAPVLGQIEEISGKEYGEGEIGVAFRVIADHIRALTFAITDGAIPGNEGRGYVLRRILRRAARFGRVLDIHKPFIHNLVEPLTARMGTAYPEIMERKEYVSRVIKAEEESFGRTLDRGIEIFEQKAASTLAAGRTIFDGADVFLLHDTYGFPLDLTALMAQEKNMTIDVDGFRREMEKQRQRSKERQVNYQTVEIEVKGESSEFVGYERDSIQAKIIHYEKGKMILDKTPFYAESGGQIGDKGTIKGEKFDFQVEDTRNIGEHIVHLGQLSDGSAPQPGEVVTASVRSEIRRATERNHTVTHLLHKALRTILGGHVHQAGSLVHSDYMRFDFTHFEKVDNKMLQKIEDLVNINILKNMPVRWQILPIDKAKQMGAMALFGEKYADHVRMIEIDDYSRELCGGTHVRATGEIGEFIITNETAVAAGIRRIEAITGETAHKHLRERSVLLDEVASLLNCRPEESLQRLVNLLREHKLAEQEIRKLRQKSTKDQIADLVQNTRQVDGVKVVAAEVQSGTIDELKHAGDLLRDALGSGIGVLVATMNDKLNFVCVVTKDLIQTKHLKAGDIVKKVAAVAGGGGGGSPHMALAGAKEVDELKHALAEVPSIVSQMLK